MPEQNEKNLPKAPAFNPKVKETIAAFKENNNPKNLNDILNELVRSPLLAPAVFDLQGQPAPKPEADGRVQLPKAIGTLCTSGRSNSPKPHNRSSCCALMTTPT